MTKAEISEELASPKHIRQRIFESRQSWSTALIYRRRASDSSRPVLRHVHFLGSLVQVSPFVLRSRSSVKSSAVETAPADIRVR